MYQAQSSHVEKLEAFCCMACCLTLLCQYHVKLATSMAPTAFETRSGQHQKLPTVLISVILAASNARTKCAKAAQKQRKSATANLYGEILGESPRNVFRMVLL